MEIVPTSTSDTEKVREPIGTGPYKIESWEAGQKLTLAANDDYWGDAPAYAKATYVWRAEGTVRAAMVLNDEADIATGLGPDDGAGDTAVAYPNNETTALRIQTYEPPLDDIRVRQAINYAIDREGITDSLFGGDAEVASQLVPDGRRRPQRRPRAVARRPGQGQGRCSPRPRPTAWTCRRRSG